MIELTQNDIVMGVLALLAGMGVMMFFILKRRKWVAIRKRAFKVSQAAFSEGLDLFAEICESIATGDIVELTREIEYLERMFSTPGALAAHLDKLFTKQLTLRLAHAQDSVEIFKAVDDARAAAEAAKAAIVQAAKDAEKLAAVVVK